MKHLLEFIVNHIADHPDEVEVREEIDPTTQRVNLFLTVHPDDMGQVIGKGGKVIKAIRHIVRIPGITQDKLVNIELLEPEQSDTEIE